MAGLIDTGSAVTIISSSVFNEILSYIDLNLYLTDPSFRIVVTDTKPLRGMQLLILDFKIQNLVGICMWQIFERME